MASRWLRWAHFWLPAVVLLAGYGWHLPGSQWVHDDHAAVVGNPLVAWPPDLGGIMAGRWFGPVARFDVFPARPLATLTYCLEIPLGLDTPWGRRMVNLALGWLCAALLGELLRQWQARRGAQENAPAPWMPAAAATLFVAHPIHVEALFCAANRPEPLSLALCLLALLAVLRERSGWLVAAIWLAALLSKESAVALAGLLGWWWMADRAERPRLQALLVPFAAALAVFAGWRAWNLQGVFKISVHPHDNPLAHTDPGTRFWSALDIAGRAASHLLWPANLAPDYTFDAWPLQTGLTSAGLAGLAVLALLSALAWRWLRRGEGGHTGALLVLGAGLGWYLPVSNLLLASTVQFADRLLFVPAAALATGAAWVLARAKPPVGAMAVAVLALAGIWQISGESAVWASPMRLFQTGVERQPRSLRMRVDLAHQIVIDKAAANGNPATNPLPHAMAALGLDAADAEVWATGFDAARHVGSCPGAEPFARALADSKKPAVNARLAAVDWGFRCQQFKRALAIAIRLKPAKLGPRKVIDVYALAVAAGQDADADRWAHFVGAQPDRDPAWLSAAVFGASQGNRPLVAADRLVALASQLPDPQAVRSQADDLARRFAQHPRAAELSAKLAPLLAPVPAPR